MLWKACCKECPSRLWGQGDGAPAFVGDSLGFRRFDWKSLGAHGEYGRTVRCFPLTSEGRITEIIQHINGQAQVFAVVDDADPQALEAYAKSLVGMTFQDVLDLGIAPIGVERDYGNKRYKGGMGTLIEERYFGYKANSDAEPDFPKADVELKSTCYDLKKDGTTSAGERLVLTMIPFDGPLDDDFFDSHLWKKCSKILLVIYERDKSIDGYQQVIRHVKLFSPPEEDLRILADDYHAIRELVQAGKAEELSEGMTNYLGACTKGATEATMWADQFYAPHAKAKRRAFCFKRQYMDHVLHRHILGEGRAAPSIAQSIERSESETFDQYVLGRIARYTGKTARELCAIFGIEYTGNKAQWTTLTYLMLGVRGERAEEFEKANVSVRTVRVEERGGIKESLSLDTFEFSDLAEGPWESSHLCEYLEETRFFFTVFRIKGEDEVLVGATFWNMPVADREGEAKRCWEQAKAAVVDGVDLRSVEGRDGKATIRNNLPKASENAIAHVRPHAARAAYRFLDGTTIGNPEKDASQLPDGRWMTKQSFWLNSGYVYGIIQDSGLGDLD